MSRIVSADEAPFERITGATVKWELETRSRLTDPKSWRYSQLPLNCHHSFIAAQGHLLAVVLWRGTRVPDLSNVRVPQAK